ncbi:UNVERIFIED_CONTAM: hypothetical protein GTU68_063767 [Idotea baltica]|nr:hypothetical protein [Idotea baltica]
MSLLNLVYEDEYLLVVDKPSGVLSQPGKSVDGSIATHVKKAYPDATGPMLVHRLDMDTSGLMVLAKTRACHRELQQQFERRRVTKCYVAVLSHNPLGQGGRIQLPIRLNIDNRPEQIVCYEHGKQADTLWHRASYAQSGEVSRVIFKPITGRTHQLRVHAAHPLGLNAAIVGDRLYGVQGDRLMLHAHRLGFTHPVSQAWLELSAAVPF